MNVVGFLAGRRALVAGALWVAAVAGCFLWWRLGFGLHLAGNSSPRPVSIREWLPIATGIAAIGFLAPRQPDAEAASPRRLGLAYGLMALIVVPVFAVVPTLTDKVLGGIIPLRYLPYSGVLERERAPSIAALVPAEIDIGVGLNIAVVLSATVIVTTLIGTRWGGPCGALIYLLLIFLQCSGVGLVLSLAGVPGTPFAPQLPAAAIITALALTTAIAAAATRRGHPLRPL